MFENALSGASFAPIRTLMPSPVPPLLAWVSVVGLCVAVVLLVVLIVQMRSRTSELERLNGTLDELAHIDPLTRLRNRRAIDQRLATELSAARRHRHPISVLLLDVDHFKLINDTHGHHAGDLALQEIGGALERALRAEDAIGRWGGEEFLAVLPFTDEGGAIRLAERLRRAVADTGREQLRRTITIGVAQWRGETPDALLAEADRALYAGKLAGRNLVAVSSAAPALHKLSVFDEAPAERPVGDLVS
jgi:diguanylate cyclase (GGDEF)-like protein